MGLFRRNKGEDTAVAEPEHDCLHVALLARWDNPDDMGHEDRASSWFCQSCSQDFTPAEAAELRETERARIGATN
jgi:hypothetical protein